MSTNQKALADKAQQHRAAQASAPDRRVWRSNGSGPHTDGRFDQLQRCIAHNQRVMDDANRVAPYLGSDPKRIAVVVAANWRAHNAYLRLTSAKDALARLATAS